MEEVSPRFKTLGGTLLCYGIAICLSHFCPLVPWWAKTKGDPMFALAAISFLLCCMVWLVLLCVDKNGCECGFTYSTISVRYIASAAVILNCICWTAMIVYVNKTCWTSCIRMPVFWLIAPFLLGMCVLALTYTLSSNYAGILDEYNVSDWVPWGVALLLVPMLIYYSVIWW